MTAERGLAWRAGWGLVWPAECAGCARPEIALCSDCAGAIAGPAFHTPVLGWPPGWGCWAASGYRGVPARLLLAWKERGRHDLARPLGAGLGLAVRACRAATAGQRGGVAGRGWGGGGAGGGGMDGGGMDRGTAEPWLLVPVPATRAARRRRGADLVLELAAHAAAVCGPGWPGQPPRAVAALRHLRRVRDQAELGLSGRRSNLHGALAVRPGSARLVAGRRCVVVDDIVTSGATAAEAARALTAAGARVVGVCSLSVTLRRDGVSPQAKQD